MWAHHRPQLPTSQMWAIKQNKTKYCIYIKVTRTSRVMFHDKYITISNPIYRSVQKFIEIDIWNEILTEWITHKQLLQDLRPSGTRKKRSFSHSGCVIWLIGNLFGTFHQKSPVEGDIREDDPASLPDLRFLFSGDALCQISFYNL